jgi:hypothetical protein
MHRNTLFRIESAATRGESAMTYRPTVVTKKADVMEHPKGIPHVGLLFNESPDRAGLLFV